MTQSSSSGEAWFEAWAASQRSYLDAWTTLMRQMPEMAERSVGGGFGQQSAPFSEGMAMWSRLLTPGLQSPARDLSERLQEIASGYLRIGESLWSAAQHAPSATTGADWQGSLNKQLLAMQEAFLGGEGGGADSAAGLATFWGMPLQHWRRLSSYFSVLPGDVEKSLRGEGPVGSEALQRELRHALETPTLGYTREWQEQSQEWASLWLEHARAVQTYEALLSKVGTRTFELLAARLMAMGREGKSVDSVRAAYDLWVDCAEDAYGETAASDEFAAAQARLTNTLMAVKRQEQRMMEEIQAGLNVPTRRELNTTHCRVQGLRRDLRALQCQLEGAEIEELRETVDALRARLERIEAGGQPSTAPAAAEQPRPRRAASPRKRTTSKGAAAPAADQNPET